MAAAIALAVMWVAAGAASAQPEPCELVVPPIPPIPGPGNPAAVPAASTVGYLAAFLLIAVAGALRVRRRRASSTLTSLAIALALVASAGWVVPEVATASHGPCDDHPKEWNTAMETDQDLPIYFVHGISGQFWPWQASSSDCAATWGLMQAVFSSWGYSGPQNTVKYYGADTNCSLHGDIHHHGDHALHYGTDAYPVGGHTPSPDDPDIQLHTEDADIRHLAYHLAWTIADHARSDVAGSMPVNVVAHSMGGVITRYMLAAWQQGQANFPTPLIVANVVTYGSPHDGSGLASLCVLDARQCRQLEPGSEFLQWLETYGQNPQGSGSTDWTLVGSDDDEVVSEGSATGMQSAHKVIYEPNQGYAHSGYFWPRPPNDANVRWDEGWDGSGYFAWKSAPHSVRWAYRAVSSSDW